MSFARAQRLNSSIELATFANFALLPPELRRRLKLFLSLYQFYFAMLLMSTFFAVAEMVTELVTCK